MSTEFESRSATAATTFDSPSLEDHRESVNYAMRTVQQTLVQLSLMADTKANILITVCSIVISLSLTQLHRPAFVKPLLVLDFFTAIALVAALLCVLPSSRRPAMKDGRVDVASPDFNPLFFQHFRHLSVEEFERELVHEFETWSGLQRALARDIHAAGTVVGTAKYRMLRISYFAFMLGVVSGAGVAIVTVLG